MLRDLVDSDNPIRRPVTALIVWVALLGGWLLVASVVGIWPFGGDSLTAVAPTAGDAISRQSDATTAPATPARQVRGQGGSTPALPRLFSPTHALGGASSVAEIEVTWGGDDATDNPATGYAYSWSTTPNTEPEPLILAAGDTTRLVSAPLPAGLWWFHLRAAGRDGSWTATAHLGPFVITATATATPEPAQTPPPATTAPAVAAPPSTPVPRSATPAPTPVRTATPVPVVPQRTAAPVAVQPTAAPPPRTAVPTPPPTEPNPDAIRPLTPVPTTPPDGIRPAGTAAPAQR